jgi:DNA-nicking Smr family endonuclease
MPARSRGPDGLDPEDQALWHRVAETVRPLKGRKAKPTAAKSAEPASPAMSPAKRAKVIAKPIKPKVEPRPGVPGDTLDGGWDKRLRRGVVAPDVTIDLHGHTLASAHAELEAGLARAVMRQARLILLVTGRPPPPGRSRLDNPLRGVIRASVGDWLDHSAHSGRIAAVRSAHPRHGGAGALYVILRRDRS